MPQSPGFLSFSRLAGFFDWYRYWDLVILGRAWHWLWNIVLLMDVLRNLWGGPGGTGRKVGDVMGTDLLAEKVGRLFLEEPPRPRFFVGFFLEFQLPEMFCGKSTEARFQGCYIWPEKSKQLRSSLVPICGGLFPKISNLGFVFFLSNKKAMTFLERIQPNLRIKYS